MREPTKQFMVRIPLSLLKQLDSFVKKKQEETGMNVTRTGAVRMILTKALRK